ncbi:hypothetical protein R1flu_021612 [Riccia fluitans]|uniref:Uncharacterized protein n=1 Tax=Riccia fluitans TaxID=41844 RepID=A0ABD1ZSX8_9MARC
MIRREAQARKLHQDEIEVHGPTTWREVQEGAALEMKTLQGTHFPPSAPRMFLSKTNLTLEKSRGHEKWVFSSVADPLHLLLTCPITHADGMRHEPSVSSRVFSDCSRLLLLLACEESLEQHLGDSLCRRHWIHGRPINWLEAGLSLSSEVARRIDENKWTFLTQEIVTTVVMLCHKTVSSRMKRLLEH